MNIIDHLRILRKIISMNTLIPVEYTLDDLKITREELESISVKNPDKQAERVRLRLKNRLLELFGGEYLKSVPKQKIVEWTGRQVKILNDQAEAYQLPALSCTRVNIPDMLRQESDWRAKYKRQVERIINKKVSDGTETDVSKLPPLERLRTAQAAQAEIKLDKMQGNLIPVTLIETFVKDLLEMYKRCVEQLYDTDNTPAASLIEKYQEDVCNAYLTQIQGYLDEQDHSIGLATDSTNSTSGNQSRTAKKPK